MITSIQSDGRPAGLPGLCLAIIEHATLPMALVDGASHLVRQVNPAFCRLVGQRHEELIGKAFGGQLAAQDELLALVDRVHRTGTFESSIQHDDVDARPLCRLYSMWPVRAEECPAGVMVQVTETGRFHEQTVAINAALMLGSMHQHKLTADADSLNTLLQTEIGERKAAEASLQRAQAQLTDRAVQLESLVADRTAELTATNQQLEAFVYSIAHDLRAPLRSMQGFSALMVGDEGTSLSERGRDFAERIDRSAQLMDAMLRDLLAFSRISQQDVELTAVSLVPVVESVLDRLHDDIKEKNAQVEYAGPWPAVRAHEPTLAQVIFNLTSNALKFITPGVPPVVRLWTEERAEFIRVWVDDNGPGIAPEFHEQIFRLFNRLHGGKYPGTGLGLAIVKKGIERMGGRVGVESVPGQGSRFWLELAKAPPAGSSRREGTP